MILRTLLRQQSICLFLQQSHRFQLFLTSRRCEHTLINLLQFSFIHKYNNIETVGTSSKLVSLQAQQHTTNVVDPASILYLDINLWECNFMGLNEQGNNRIIISNGPKQFFIQLFHVFLKFLNWANIFSVKYNATKLVNKTICSKLIQDRFRIICQNLNQVLRNRRLHSPHIANITSSNIASFTQQNCDPLRT